MECHAHRACRRRRFHPRSIIPAVSEDVGNEPSVTCNHDVSVAASSSTNPNRKCARPDDSAQNPASHDTDPASFVIQLAFSQPGPSEGGTRAGYARASRRPNFGSAQAYAVSGLNSTENVFAVDATNTGGPAALITHHSHGLQRRYDRDMRAVWHIAVGQCCDDGSLRSAQPAILVMSAFERLLSLRLLVQLAVGVPFASSEPLSTNETSNPIIVVPERGKLGAMILAPTCLSTWKISTCLLHR
ncbi:hypothetical protein BDZ89DRAFT_1233659 [Hymenopellis radicata]|nr:hypothetical protein BDZ89DRAFT_1233659 [Hymenopellis radicata]